MHLLAVLIIVLIVIIAVWGSPQKAIIQYSNGSPQKAIVPIDNDATVLFWTGGFDSTFRLCELAIEQQRKVQPICLVGSVDGVRNGRQNQKAERHSRWLIVNDIRKQFPHVKVYNPIEIDVTNIRITNGVDRLQKYGMTLGAHSRPINQYAYMSQLTTDGNFVGEICATSDGTIQKMVTPYLTKDYRVVSNAPVIYAPYRNLRFPTMTRTKNDMYVQALRNGYVDILHKTWSCWYPKKNTTHSGTTYTPCGVCNMCKERLMPAEPLTVN